MMVSNVYLVKLWNENETFYKIGVSCHKFCRFYQLMKFGYNAKIIFMPLKIDTHLAYNLESSLHCKFRHLSYLPRIKFGGYTECYKDIDIDEYKSFITKKISYHFNYLEGIEISWR